MLHCSHKRASLDSTHVAPQLPHMCPPRAGNAGCRNALPRARLLQLYPAPPAPQPYKGFMWTPPAVPCNTLAPSGLPLPTKAQDPNICWVQWPDAAGVLQARGRQGRTCAAPVPCRASILGRPRAVQNPVHHVPLPRVPPGPLGVGGASQNRWRAGPGLPHHHPEQSRDHSGCKRDLGVAGRQPDLLVPLRPQHVPIRGERDPGRSVLLHIGAAPTRHTFGSMCDDACAFKRQRLPCAGQHLSL